MGKKLSYKPMQKRPSKLDPYKDYIARRLQEYPELTAVRIFEEIQGMGYTGKLTILKDYTRPLRRRQVQAVLRYETRPGWQGQVDWSEVARVRLDDMMRRLHCYLHGPGLLQDALRRVHPQNGYRGLHPVPPQRFPILRRLPQVDPLLV